MGEMGLQTVEQVLPNLREERQVDLVIAQSENASDGKGITPADFQRLRNAGVDFCTGGNHSLDNPGIFDALKDPDLPIIQPANIVNPPGPGWKYVSIGSAKVLVISLLGTLVGKDAGLVAQNALLTIDRILNHQQEVEKAAIVVNLHGDFSSQKIIMGHYLDGKATLVVGDHWHVQTADARVLPGGTAHITDVGMCGSLDSSIGVTFDSVIPRWRDDKQTRNVLETQGARQLNAVLVEANQNGLADSIEQIRQII